MGCPSIFDFVVNDIAVELLTQHFVHHVHLDGGAILALDDSHGNLTRAETRDVGTLTIIFQGLVYLRLVVLFLQCDGHQTIDLVWSFKCDIHLLIIPYLLIYIRFERAKVRKKVKSEE